MEEKLRLPLGRTDYKKICDNNYYVDKTLLVKELLDEEVGIILFTRPRRFGKTLNMDMLRTFFEKTEEDTSKYFIDKNIWSAGEKYTRHQGQYPVIYLSLKDIKARKWETAYEILKYIISVEYVRHAELKNSSELEEAELNFYNRITSNRASIAEYQFSLQALSRMLHQHHKQPPVIIIDEYDTPIQEGYVNGYYNEAVEFIRNFFSAALKDNPHMTISILTGILRIAKESIFSGLNNIRIYSVLDEKFSSYFGFTAPEVQTLAAYYGKLKQLPEIKAWYDGYKFGDTEIVNPWSVINYFNHNCQPMPFWVQTSGNAVIHEIIKNLQGVACDNLRKLLDGVSVISVIETNIIYPRLKEPQTNILGFLLMTGYLKSTNTTLNEDGAYVCELSIPNKELRTIYRKEILSLLTEAVGEEYVYSLQQALLNKDGELLKTALNKFMLQSISYYDGLKENYYHGLLLGMTVLFAADYYPLSNRESGEGRYDIELLPKHAQLPGIIMELKTVEKSSEASLKDLARKALEQIDTKQYAMEMLARGIGTIHKFGVAFCGKKAEIVTN